MRGAAGFRHGIDAGPVGLCSLSHMTAGFLAKPGCRADPAAPPWRLTRDFRLTARAVIPGLDRPGGEPVMVSPAVSGRAFRIGARGGGVDDAYREEEAECHHDGVHDGHFFEIFIFTRRPRHCAFACKQRRCRRTRRYRCRPPRLRRKERLDHGRWFRRSWQPQAAC